MLSTTPVYGEEKKRNESAHLAPDAKSAILMEQDTGKILFDKNAHEKLPPASMTKIMTLLIIMEQLDKGNLTKDELVRVSENASSMGGSQVFLETGEEMTVDDLLKSIAIASGNDASVALAERIAGSEEAFVKMMNEKVKELKLKNTTFQNSSGLPADDHYSTAYDMAIIANELLKYESITDYTSIYEDYLRKGTDNEFWLVNTNKLVKFYPGVDGLKTGYTNEAKYCLAATAKKDDMRVIAVIMGADTIKERNANISNMLDYAYNHFETKKLFDQGETITKLDMFKAEQQHIDVSTRQSVSVLFKKGQSDVDDITTHIDLYEDIDLPLQKGEQVGVLTVKHKGDVLSETPLIVTNEIHRASYFKLWKRAIQKLSKSV